MKQTQDKIKVENKFNLETLWREVEKQLEKRKFRQDF